MAIDLPGHGGSRKEDICIPYSLVSLGTAVKQTIEKAKLHSYIIVASSISSNIAGEICRELEHCKGYVLIGSCIMGQLVAVADLLMPSQYTHVLFDANPADDDLAAYIRTLTFRKDEYWCRELASLYRQTDPTYRTQIGEAVARSEWTDEIKNLNDTGLPVCVIMGEEEEIVNKNYLNGYLMHKWNNREYFIKEAGHLAYLDQPEQVNQLIFDFAKDMLL